MMNRLVLGFALAASGCMPLPRATPDTGLRVLVYNIHAGKDAAGADNLARVAAMIAESGADLVLLQEVDSATRRGAGVDQLASLAARTGMHGIFGSTIEWQGGSFGLGILSRYPIVAHSFVPLRTDPMQPRIGYTREPRAMLIASIATPRGVLAVLNTHLDASRDGQWRSQEAAHLVAVADSLQRAGARVILGGDLNAPLHTGDFRNLGDGDLVPVSAEDAEGGAISSPPITPPLSGPKARLPPLWLG